MFVEPLELVCVQSASCQRVRGWGCGSVGMFERGIGRVKGGRERPFGARHGVISMTLSLCLSEEQTCR